VASLRVSGADARERHLGVSHHSTTAYGRVALSPADVVVPGLAGSGAGLEELDARVRSQARALGAPLGRHRLVDVATGPDLLDALRGTPVRLSTMGRGLDADPASFLAVAAAGAHAEALAAGPPAP
jgi:hypothetical protein